MADDSFLRGLISECIDAQQRLHGRELTNDDKRAILNFCYCKAPNVPALVPEPASKQKFLARDPEIMAAVARIDAACIEGERSAFLSSAEVGEAAEPEAWSVTESVRV